MIGFVKEHQLNVMLALAAISGIIVIFVLLTNHISKRKKNSILIMALSSMILLFADRLAYIYRGDMNTLAFYMVRICNYLVYATSLSIIYGFNEYLISFHIDNSESSKKSDIPIGLNIAKYLVIIGEIILILSQFTDLYYYFDDSNLYQRGRGFILCYIFPLISIIIQCITILKYHKKTRQRILIPILLFTILPLIATITQIFLYGVSLTNITSVCMVVLLYVSTIRDADILLQERERMESELQIASQIQINECPNEFPAFPDRKEFDLYGTMIPAKEVGGDFYDYYLLDDDHLAIAIADVSGKGVPAALNMVKAKILLKGVALYTDDPAKALDLLNHGFIDNNKFEMFVTVWLGILELSTGNLKFANAGHESVIIYNEQTGFDIYKSRHGVPIGAMPENKYKNQEIVLKKGDKLFLYTDGVLDSINENNEKFGINNLLKILNKHTNKGSKELIETIEQELEAYSRNCDQFDDITMLCFEYCKDENVDNNKIYLEGKFKADVKEVKNVFEYFTDTMASIIGIEKVKNYYIVIDEIFSNIAKYGFKDKSKDNYIVIKLNMNLIKRNIKITFEDEGIPFNPLENDDPNTNLSAKKREEGGLGIFIVKKMMDKVSYEYKNNKNIFIIEKKY